MMIRTLRFFVILSSGFSFLIGRSSTRLSSIRLFESEYCIDGTESHWVTWATLKMLADEADEDFSLYAAIHSDFAYYDEDSVHPVLYRIRKSFHKKTHLTNIKGTLLNSSDVPMGVDLCARQTVRWCLNFVSGLNLCPWAKLSLKDGQAIRLKIVEQNAGLHQFERVIRESAQELIRISDKGYVDPNVAITFVVAIGDSYDFEFEQFYDFSSDLEDRLYEEADRSVDDSESCIGNEITIAPFHPDWKFLAEESDTLDALNFEKKSPYPTVSLVRTFVIDQAGEEATTRIGIHNEKILDDYGVEKLQRIYDHDVRLDG